MTDFVQVERPIVCVHELNNEIALMSFQEPPADFVWQDQHLKFNARIGSTGQTTKGGAACDPSRSSQGVESISDNKVEVKCYWFETMRTLRRSWNISTEEIEKELDFGPLVRAEAAAGGTNGSFYSCRRRLKFAYMSDAAIRSFNARFKQYADYVLLKSSRSVDRNGTAGMSDLARGSVSFLPKIVNLVRLSFGGSDAVAASPTVGSTSSGQYYLVTVMPYPVLYNELVHNIKVNCLPPKPVPAASKSDKEAAAATALAASTIYYGELDPEHVSAYKPSSDKPSDSSNTIDSAVASVASTAEAEVAVAGRAKPKPSDGEPKKAWQGRFKAVVDFPAEIVHVSDLVDEYQIKLLGEAKIKVPKPSKLPESTPDLEAVWDQDGSSSDGDSASAVTAAQAEDISADSRPTVPSRHDLNARPSDLITGAADPVSPSSVTTDDDAEEDAAFTVHFVQNRELVLQALRSDIALIKSIQGYRFSLQVVVTKRLTEGRHYAPGECFGPLISEAELCSDLRPTLIARHDVDFAKYYDDQEHSCKSTEAAVDMVNPVQAALAGRKAPDNVVNSDVKRDGAGAGDIDIDMDTDGSLSVTVVDAPPSRVQARTPRPLPEVADYSCYDALYPRLIPTPLSNTHDPTSKRRIDWDYYISFEDIFESYELEDKMRKYTDIVSNLAKNYGKMPDRTYMRPDSYSQKLYQFLESDVFVASEGDVKKGKYSPACNLNDGTGASATVSNTTFPSLGGGTATTGAPPAGMTNKMSNMFNSLMKPKVVSTSQARPPLGPSASSFTGPIGGTSSSSNSSSTSASASGEQDKSFFSMFKRGASVSGALRGSDSATTSSRGGGMFRFGSSGSLSDKDKSKSKSESANTSKGGIDPNDLNYNPTEEELKALEEAGSVGVDEEDDDDYLHYRRGHV